VSNVYLGRYISFDDTVTLDDISRAFEQAIRDELAKKTQIRRAPGLHHPLDRRTGHPQLD